MLVSVAFEGSDKRYIIDDKPFGGNLYQQYQQAMPWLKGKLNIRYDIEGQGAETIVPHTKPGQGTQI